MIRNRLPYLGLLTLVVFACACTADVGACEGALAGRDTVVVNNTVIYGGQAIMNKACATGCHLSTATRGERRGVPAGLDFDLIPVDEADAAGAKRVGGNTIVKLKEAQIVGLRERQYQIVQLRDQIWQQIEDKLMPPGGSFGSVMSSIFASSEKTPCKLGKSYSVLSEVKTREVLRNWLACGAPLVETNGAKLTKSAAAGMIGDQYRACVQDPEQAVTLESLFKTTFSECGGCHNDGITGPPSFLTVEALAESLRTTSACGGKPFVTPGEPDESYLLDLLKAPNPDCRHQQMPAGGLGPLSDRAIAEVSDWIAAGAPTSAGDVEPPMDETANDPVDESDQDQTSASSDD